jgi:hypothetical protein
VSEILRSTKVLAKFEPVNGTLGATTETVGATRFTEPVTICSVLADHNFAEPAVLVETTRDEMYLPF